ncbi:MAG: DUF937 domain-containing protein [Steroidobacteraceae bacterium]
MNIFDAVKAQLSDQVVGALATTIGSDATSTGRSATEAALPAVLGGLVSKFAGSSGAAALSDLLRNGGFDGSLLDNLGGALSGGRQTTQLMDDGKALTDNIFGARSDAVTEFLGGFAGLGRQGGSKLLSLIIPVVLSALGREVRASNLGASGIAGIIGGLAAMLPRISPPGLAAALGQGAGATEAQAATTAASAVDRRAIWPWIIVPLIAFALFLVLRKFSQVPAPAVEPAPAPGIEAPAQPAPQEETIVPPADELSTTQAVDISDLTAGMPADSVAFELGQYLADPSSEAGRSFVLAGLNFDSGTAVLQAGSAATLDDVARILDRFGDVELSLNGHTDASGNESANQRLSEQRANAVMQALVERGIAASRMSAAGLGSSQPIASNDDADGRARNRRTELIVTALKPAG